VIVVVKARHLMVNHCCLQARAVHHTSSNVFRLVIALPRRSIVTEIVIAPTAVTSAVCVLRCSVGSWTIRTLDYSYPPGLFVPGTILTALGLFVFRRFIPWNLRPPGVASTSGKIT